MNTKPHQATPASKLEQFTLDLLNGKEGARETALTAALMSIADSLETIAERSTSLPLMLQEMETIRATGVSALRLMTLPPHQRDRVQVIPSTGGIILPEPPTTPKAGAK